MFTDQRIATIFGNLEQIHSFSAEFIADLETSIITDAPELSSVGNCFLKWVRFYLYPLVVSKRKRVDIFDFYIDKIEKCSTF